MGAETSEVALVVDGVFYFALCNLPCSHHHCSYAEKKKVVVLFMHTLERKRAGESATILVLLSCHPCSFSQLFLEGRNRAAGCIGWRLTLPPCVIDRSCFFRGRLALMAGSNSTGT